MVNIFLITANTGSVFENVELGLGIWMKEVISTVSSHNPQFVAIHFQETGGKYYKNGSNVIDIFFRALVENFQNIGLLMVIGFIDSDVDVETEYTALASAYFMRENLTGVQIWNFQDKEFVDVSPGATRLLSGKDLKVGTMHKEKFPRHFFPNSVWSRKGFLRTRWNIQGTLIELVNIHLFHDSSNLTACSTSPSPFAQNRRKTLDYLFEKFQSEDDSINLPRFIFGDFNFRVNTFEVFDILRKESACLSEDGSENSEMFEVDDKRFVVNNLEEKFKHNYHWLRPYDFEVSHFSTIVGEFDVNFHPTYPFDEALPDKFLRTRCPAWCDRVLFTQNALDSISKEFPTEYNLIGGSVCMGDHKPVYLKFELKTLMNPEPESKDESNQPLMPNPMNTGISSSSISSSREKCGFVSFLRENLNFSLRCGSDSSNLSSKLSSIASSPSNLGRHPPRNVDGKCCFRSNNSTTSVAPSLENQSVLNTNIVQQQNNDGLDDSKEKDVNLVKPIYVFDGDSLKENSKKRISNSENISKTQRPESSRQTECCACNII